MNGKNDVKWMKGDMILGCPSGDAWPRILTQALPTNATEILILGWGIH